MADGWKVEKDDWGFAIKKYLTNLQRLLMQKTLQNVINLLRFLITNRCRSFFDKKDSCCLKSAAKLAALFRKQPLQNNLQQLVDKKQLQKEYILQLFLINQ